MTATIQPPLDPSPDRNGTGDAGISPPADLGEGATAPSSGITKAQVSGVAAVALLVVLALTGFGAAYGGSRFLLAGTVGVVLGAAVALLGARRRWGAPFVALMSLVVFFVFGGAVTLANPQLGGLVPTPANVADLLDGATQGWARLITANPPVGARLNLLVVPYLCGLVSTVVGGSIAARSKRPMWGAVAPLIVLVLGTLFSTSAAPKLGALVLQGSLFGAVLIGWWASAHRARRLVDVGTRDVRRAMSMVVVLVGAALVATAAGEFGLIPGMNSRPRFVLRDMTEPPFDPAEFPSPLNSFRRYTNGPLLDGEPVPQARVERDGWRSAELFEVSGLPNDRRLRLATLDSYDGTVFGVGAGSGSSGHFERVGDQLPNAVGSATTTEGAERDTDDASVTVEVLAPDGTSPYQDIWVPVPDGAEQLRVESDDADRQFTISENLHFNAATGTAAVPLRLQPGDRIRVEASIPSASPSDEVTKVWAEAAALPTSTERLQIESASAAARQLVDGSFCTAQNPAAASDPAVPTDTAAVAAPSRTPYELVRQLGSGLVACGAYSDGDTTDVASPPGHSAWRLNGMLADNDGAVAQLIGNGEQYAPLAAVLADTLGAPTRVVMGFRSRDESDRWRTSQERTVAPHSGDTYLVTGSDATTWIEVGLEGIGWVPVLDVIPEQPQPQERPKPQNPKPQNEPPPPPPSIPPSEEDLTDADRLPPEPPTTNEEDGFAIPGWVFTAAGIVLTPVAVLAAITGLIAWLKTRRRARRRSTGTADARIAGGWDEVKDLAADLGQPVPSRSTRSEEAGFIGTDEVRSLATHADALVFGPAPPDELPTEQYWDRVEAARSSMTAPLSRFGRWKALVNLASFRRRGGTSRSLSLPLPRTASGTTSISEGL